MQRVPPHVKYKKEGYGKGIMSDWYGVISYFTFMYYY